MNKEKYICPMHPEEKSTKPARCKKCGMNLVLESEVSKDSYHEVSHHSESKNTIKDYLPLFIIIGLITLVAYVTSLNSFSLTTFIERFMIGFFIVFAGFKLIDLEGFAQGYSTYDLLAMRWFNYGYIYPFIELGFGLAMILNLAPKQVLIAEIIVMTFSGVGVLRKLMRKEKFQCACLGTFLKVPLTKVTLIEDFGMAFLAFLLLIL